MRLSVKVTPKFNTKTYLRKTIGKDWMRFQHHALKMGHTLHGYVQGYINSHRKRGGGTGNLANSVNFEISSSSPTRVSWGVGNINLLQTKAPYWYVINYGKMVTGEAFRPGNGKAVAGFFGAGNPPLGALKGRGTESFTPASKGGYAFFPGVIRPMHYIQASMTRLDIEFKKVIQSLRRSK